MDERRLSSMDILAYGLLNKPVPKTDIPTARKRVDAENIDLWQYIGNDAVIAALERGELIDASNYYGCASLWKQADGVYRGILLQYHSVTENPTFDNAQTAAEWFEDIYHKTYG